MDTDNGGSISCKEFCRGPPDDTDFDEDEHNASGSNRTIPPGCKAGKGPNGEDGYYDAEGNFHPFGADGDRRNSGM